MSIIDDKEVGEIWRTEHRAHDQGEYCERCTIDALIRKLVAERAMRTMLGWKGTDWAEGFDAATNIALGDFGIDPADWKDDDS